ncbi:putative polysaccharide export protein [Selenomonas ruminantium subsp. lactilytica TAM6421]|uniref:Putative polysaccharide export protein n=1 Tax=Selenomonas ruminantium subsp. lactilytica (strain NBRC 103574 / TAM6421) TaxID=927704 RepID=I0GRR4_SELRL|nr:polysaccharide biosynthesis/export family protein [Selenomonas ruminantium]BAL83451.1 putative polysaccharide export protein [Selenomonas ruminantium subsp. lactilytica TAM6421]
MKKELLVISTLLTLAQPVSVMAGSSDAAAQEMASAQPAVQSPQRAQNKEYTLRPGDELNISVLQDERISNAPNSVATPYVVRPDGRLSLPYVGSLDVTGMTIDEVTSLLTQALSRYYVNPEVTVNLTKMGAVRVYVFGEVKNPGVVELTKSHTIVDAIGSAGSFTADAAKKKVILVRKEDQQNMINVDFNAMITKGDMTQNYELQEGDILYLTRNHRITFARDIAPLIAAAYNISKISD